MITRKIDEAISYFKEYKKSWVIITDIYFKVLWSNSEEASEIFLKDFNKNNIFSCADLLQGKTSLSIELDGTFYTLSIIPIFQEGHAEGFIFKPLTREEIFKLRYQKKFLSDEFEMFSKIRSEITNIVGLSTNTHTALLNNELYEDADSVDRIINCCYKLLAATLNRAEIIKIYNENANKTKMNVVSFLKDIINTASTILMRENVELSFKSSDDEIYLTVDSDRFLSVILNLLINAVKYNVSDKKKVAFSLKKHKEDVVLSVSDNGIGMNNITVEKIFEKKDIFDEQKYSKGYGTYILNAFCKINNGKIMITTKENEGSIISIKLPLSPTDEALPEYVNHRTADYITNRFSNLYIYLSTITRMKFL